MTQRTPEQKRLCLLALLIAASMLGAEFLALAHQVTAHHAYCLAHGHMVDAEVVAAEAGTSAEAAPIEGAALRAQALLAGHAHGHCDKTVFLQVGELAAAAPTALVGVAQVEHSATAPAAPRAAIALLFLAPKHSPPVVG